ncbi:MAG: C25 family cysteine peptidase, partial [Caldisericia bacterium]
MIKKIASLILLLLIFSFFKFELTFGEEEKFLEFDFQTPNFIEYGTNSIIPEIIDFNDYLLIPNSPIVPYKIFDYEFPLKTEITSVEFIKQKEFENIYNLDKPLTISPEPRVLSNLSNGFLDNYPINYNSFVIERRKSSIILHLRITPFEVDKDDLLKLSFYKKVRVKIKYRDLNTTQSFKNLKANYDLLIITPQEYQEYLNDFINHKNQKNIPTTIFTLEYINSNFSGRDTQEKIKYAIKYGYDNLGIKYVLLVGDSEKIPPRYVAVNDGSETTLPSDLYYGDLYNSSGQFDSWDQNNNNIFGEYNSSGNIDRPDLYPDVSVGRIPVSNVDELNNYINKVIYYEN